MTKLPLMIIHGGQTGVDRGAHEAATDIGWQIGGFMPSSCRDEYGPIPSGVSRHLTRCATIGYGARTEANLAIAHALLVVVSDADDPYRTPGTKKTLLDAREIRLPREVVDATSDDLTTAAWLRLLFNQVKHQNGQLQVPPFRLMVAGPRESKWTDGRVQTAAFLRRVARQLAKP